MTVEVDVSRSLTLMSEIRWSSLAEIRQNDRVINDPEQCYRAVSQPRQPFRRVLCHRRAHNWYLLPPVMSGHHAEAAECVVLRVGRRGATSTDSVRVSAAGRMPSPGSPEWNVRADVVGRAMRLIADGVVDREGVKGLAERLNYSERQLNRLLTAEMGAGPLALARIQRAQTARLLIETTAMSFTDVAFASGFSSVRQFNDTVREVFAAARRRSFARGAAGEPIGPGAVHVHLPHRPPFDAESIFAFFGLRARFRVSSRGTATTYSRVLTLPHGHGVVALRPADGVIDCELRLDDWRDLQAAVQRCRRMLDLDADPVAVDAAARCRRRCLRRSLRRRPGLRSPAHVDGDELAIRARARSAGVGGRSADTGRASCRTALGEPLRHPVGRDSRTRSRQPTRSRTSIPTSWPMPHVAQDCAAWRCARRSRPATIVIDPGVDRTEMAARCSRCAVSVRGPSPTSRCVRSVIPTCSCPPISAFVTASNGSVSTVRRRARRPQSEAWRPWRSYALHHLWAQLSESLHDSPNRSRTPMLYSTIIDSPVGPLTLVASEKGLRAVLWNAEDCRSVCASDPSTADDDDPNGVLAAAAEQLDEYFAGARIDFDMPLDPVGSDFQRSAWDALRTIPYGETVSYGEQARRMGDVRKARGGRRGERTQPDLDHRAVSPRRRRRRIAHRLRRRRRDEGLAARSRTSRVDGVALQTACETSQFRWRC